MLAAINIIQIIISITLIAMFTDPMTIVLQTAKSAEHLILGSLTYDGGDFEAAMRVVPQKLDILSGFVTHRFPLEEATRAFDLAETRTEDVVRVVFHP